MSISGVRTGYDHHDVDAVAEATGAKPRDWCAPEEPGAGGARRHRDGCAVIVAFAAASLAWIGHLTWMINRPGGRLDGEEAGHPVGEVQRVDTREGFGRRGVAERMYHQARQVAGGQGRPAEIDHNPSRTAVGERWAEKVGGWRPPLTNGQPLASFEDLVRALGDGAADSPPPRPV